MMNLYCSKKDLQKIKDNKEAFIDIMIGLNIAYDVCGLMSRKMNEAINEIENNNIKKQEQDDDGSSR
jgi:hypothetical protein